MSLYKSLLSSDKVKATLSFVGIYLLCLGFVYFFIKTQTPKPGEDYYLISYSIVSVWYAWVSIHNFFLLKRFLFERKWGIYVVLLIIGISIAAFCQQQILNSSPRGYVETYADAIFIVSFYTLVGTIIFLAFLYLKESRKFFQTASLKKEVELQQLKSQLNPHFLFNALNNIYSYNVKNNSFGNDLVLKLSQLMRFIVESSPKDSIPLSEEISFIDNYVAFETERLGYRCEIQYKKKIEFPERKIPPLILFPFIENAFKHGTNTIQQSKILIELNDSNGGIDLLVKNNIMGQPIHSTKTGLSNAERRLELLFAGKHNLHIDNHNGEYIVNLKLELL